MNLGIVVQVGAVTIKELDHIHDDLGLKLEVVVDWDNNGVTELLSWARSHPGSVGLWRFTQQLFVPDEFIEHCRWAVFANEPDIEGYPEFYGLASGIWIQNGGLIVEPAWHDERNRKPDPWYFPHAISWHAYDVEFRNRDMVMARNTGLPVFGTEYGCHSCVSQLRGPEASDASFVELINKPEQIFLWTWRWKNNSGEYNLADVDQDLLKRRLDTVRAMAPSGPVMAERKDAMALTINDTNDYCTEIGPDGSGHNRCGPAVIASCLLSAGWKSDPWGLVLEVTGKVLGSSSPASPSETVVGGMTVVQVEKTLQDYGLKSTTFTAWQDAVDAIGKGNYVCLLVDNWYLRPRMYPAGGAWDALHWVRLIGFYSQKYAILLDPLVYVPGEYPTPYQGPSVVDVASLKAAIGATPVPESGVIAWR